MSDTTIPYPENPQHVDNLVTIPLLEAQGFEGPDASLEYSVFDYDICWRLIPEELRDGSPDDYLFVFRHGKQFRRATMNSSKFDSDFDWIKPEDWKSFLESHGFEDKEEWMEQIEYPARIDDLYNYYGPDNVFGSAANDCNFDIRDPQKYYGAAPAPGETPEEYRDRLIGAGGDEPVIGLDFVRGEQTIHFVSGGGDCVGCQLHQWHSGTDVIYAVGSMIVANKGVYLESVKDAADLLEARANAKDQERSDEAPFDKVHGLVLVELMRAALAAEPDEDHQTADL